MPGKVKVKILAGRNLPVMDRSSDTTDAYVEIKFGNTTYKTDVCRKSLNPQWNSEWYRFEVDDAELQDEPLQIRLMDHDTYSANDAIGKVYLDLNPLLLPGSPPPVKNIWTLEASMSSSTGGQGGSVMTGWIPVYDTMHGIRGEVNIIVKVELFSDFNKFRQSSCGVQFFCSPIVPHGYHAQVIHGFVEELVVNDDPEYKWIDKIRTPRASNEARQTLFFKLSGGVQRKIGLKALDLGGNAVIGYHQCFDLEGESGIVARGIGTAVSLVKMHDISSVPVEDPTAEELALLGLLRKTQPVCSEVDDSVPLLSPSPNHSPILSASNLQSTRVSNRFPGYGKTMTKPTKPLMKVSQYKSAGSSYEKSKQLSQQSIASIYNTRRAAGSSQSLSDDFNDELSLRSMLAQEDMRGEDAGNRFSRGLKSLRYLPQNMLSKKVNQFKARFSESLDEESDLDSSFSSTWSIGGSDSARSSLADIYSMGKKKKATHKKNTNEGMAALLIRSVHNKLALDSVMEDHETPTPSPVKFLSESLEFSDVQSKRNEEEIDKNSCSTDSDKHDKSDLEMKLRRGTEPPFKEQHELAIGVSSSETDTSTSDDEPSESSTNYNILDDSTSMIDPGSPVDEKCRPRLIKPAEILINEKELLRRDNVHDGPPSDEMSNLEKMEPKSLELGSYSWYQKMNCDEEKQLIPQSSEPSTMLFNDRKLLEREVAHDRPSTDEIVDSEKIRLQSSDCGTNIWYERMHSVEGEGLIPQSNKTSKISIPEKEQLERVVAPNEPPSDAIYNFDGMELKSSGSGSHVWYQKRNSAKEGGLISDSDRSPKKIIRKKELARSSDTHSLSDDENASLIATSEIVAITSSMTSKKTEFLDKQEHFDDPDDSMPAAASTPTENDDECRMFFPDIKMWSEPYLQRSISLKEPVKRQSLMSKIKLKPKSESFKSEKENKFSILKQFENSQKCDLGTSDHSTPTSSEFPLEEKEGEDTELLLVASDEFDRKIQALSLNAHKHKSPSTEGTSSFCPNPSKNKSISKYPQTSGLDAVAKGTMVSQRMEEVKGGNDRELLLDSKNITGTSHVRPDTGTNKPTKFTPQKTQNLEINSFTKETGLPEITDDRKAKSPRKVERTETVIYKGPSKPMEKITIPIGNRDITGKVIATVHALPKPVPIVTAPSTENNHCHLTVPVVKVTDFNVKSTFTPSETKQGTQQTAYSSAPDIPPEDVVNINHKYRQHCMLDLIKTIDTKMMLHHHHHERKDSTKSKRRKREIANLSLTPSPDSVRKARSHRKKSKSKSPEGSVQNLSMNLPNPHHHHHHAPLSPPVDSVSVTKHSFGPPVGNALSNDFSETNTEKPEKSGHHLEISHDFPNQPNNSHTSYVSKNNTPAMSEVAKHENTKIHQSAAKSLTQDLQDDFSDRLGDDVEMIKLDSGLTNTRELLAPIETGDCRCHSACSLGKLQNSFYEVTNTTNSANVTDSSCVPCLLPSPRQQEENSQPATSTSPGPQVTAIPTSVTTKISQSPASRVNSAAPIHRRSSDSDLSITPKGNSLTGSDRSSMGGYIRPATAVVRPMNQEALDMLEYPFITMQQYPPGFILHIGGTVCARSVKLLERISNLEEPESRDAWWTEIRMEVRSHARALACNVVLGYREDTSICDDVCVLSATGTAAVINLQNAAQDSENALINRVQQGVMTTSLDSAHVDREKAQQKVVNSKNEKTDDTPAPVSQPQIGKSKNPPENNEPETPHPLAPNACSICHLPYSENSVPFRVNVLKCVICRRGKVPDVIFTTIELPENVPITGRGCFVQATVSKPKRDLRGELNAKEISDCLPFLEYEIHSLLLNKLKVKGMNALFGLKVQVSVGERLVIGMATGTAVYLSALPAPAIPKVASGNSWNDDKKLADIQRSLIDTVKKNREFYQLKSIADIENGRPATASDTDESDEDLPEMDLGSGNKDACVLEVDDIEDIDRISMLMDNRPPNDFHVVNTQTIPGLEDLEIVRNLQMFTQLWRAKIPPGQPTTVPTKYFGRLLQSVYFKLRRMVPCALCNLQFKVELPEPDEIQLSVVGMALGLGEPTKLSKYKRKLLPHSMSRDQVKKTEDNDMIFSLDEDNVVPENAVAGSIVSNTLNSTASNSSSLSGNSTQRARPRSPLRTRSHMMHKHRHVPLKERYGVDITPLSYMPGGRIDRYLGNLNFFFIRESTAIREGGGLSGFVHSFVTEVLAIVRAHVTALGGNAMVAYFMTHCILFHSPHKNQGQCLINVGGDVVSVSYFGDDKHPGSTNC